MSKKKVLIVQYFIVQSDDKEYQRNRQYEIDYCFLKNTQNPYIDEIHTLTESYFDFAFVPEEQRKKIKQIIIGKRLTYEYVFKYYNKHLANTICILANADIYMDESLEILDHIIFTNTVLVVTRYENDDDSKPPLLYGLEVNANNKLISPYTPTVWSQDVWIWNAPSIDIPESNFSLGIPGCDCYILYLIITAGFTVYNPSHLLSVNHYDRMSISISNDGKKKGIVSKNRHNSIKSKEFYRFISIIDDIFDKYTRFTDYTMNSSLLLPTFKKTINQPKYLVSASSWKTENTPEMSLFNSPGYWSPINSDKNPYLECVFEGTYKLKIIDIRGRPVDKDNLENNYVSKFLIVYNIDTDIWIPEKEYIGITTKNGNIIKRTYVDLECKGVRIYPLTYVGSRALKVRFFGILSK
jgi:hypothetical protein